MNTNEIENNDNGKNVVDNNQNRAQTKSKSIIKYVMLLILLTAIISLAGFAYARFIRSSNGQLTAQIANYNFNVTAGNSTNINIDLASTRLANDTTRVVSGQIAPDTKGAFNLNINASRK